MAPVIDPEDRLYLGIMTGPRDPSAAIVRNGKVLALVDEERFVRDKHAFNRFPLHAIASCLKIADADLADIHEIAVPWDIAAHSDGRMATFYDKLSAEWPVDRATREWQQTQLRTFHAEALRKRFSRELRSGLGAHDLPPIVGPGHHRSHAVQAGFESPFHDALVVVLDGSGDRHSGTVWSKQGPDLKLRHEVLLPHSVGWFYAAITEYLGFPSSDSEYKVMGLAAFGARDPALRALVDRVLLEDEYGVSYRLDPTFIHYGRHSFSGRFTDALADLFGRPPRTRGEKLESWHMNLAFAAQEAVEDAVVRLVQWGVRTTGIRSLALGGGVAMNVKVNARVAALDDVDAVFAHPSCADNGAAAGAALTACMTGGGGSPRPIGSVALGPSFTDTEIASILNSVGAEAETVEDVEAVVARELAAGRIVGRFSGRMEAGSRALGHRSILADPRSIESRNRVNAVIKHREPWRPFGPSMPAEVLDRYTDDIGDARFMTIAFRANDRLRADAPAVVHVDGTSRIHAVVAEENPDYHRLLVEFGRLTGVPIVLNTSFNLAGEPIVCTPVDALRTFWSSGMDVLVLASHVLRKPRPPAVEVPNEGDAEWRKQ